MPGVMVRLQHALRPCRDDQGSAMVELALSASIFFAFIFGICQICYAIYIYQYVSDAAREASRYAMVRGSTCGVNTPSQTNCPTGGITTAQVTNYVKGLGFPGVQMKNLSVTTNWCGASSTTPTTWTGCSISTSETPGNLVKVTVTYKPSLYIPWTAKFNGSNSLTISSTSSMVIAQ